MKWRRPARIGLAVIGLGFALALFFFRRDRPEPPPVPTSTIVSDPEALSESAGGRVEHFHDGELEFTVEHAGQRTYAEGRAVFLEAHVTFAETGREIWADQLETLGQFVNTSQPGKLLLSGNVRLVEGDALRVETEEATYDDRVGTLDIPGAVTFVKGGMSGSGVGATYDREADLFRILAEAKATVDSGEEGTEPLALSSSRMSLARAQNYLQMDESARIVRATETLAGDSATITFTDTEGQVRYLELRGHASVTPQPGTSAVPEMKADDITLAFRPVERTLEHSTLTGSASLRLREEGGERVVEASWLDIYLAPDGQTLTRLDGRGDVRVSSPARADTPAREIRSKSLSSGGTAAAGLQRATFEGDVSFVETPAARRDGSAVKRTGRASWLTMTLDGGLDAITSAIFRQNAVFETGDMHAEADRARYLSKEGRLVLEKEEPQSTRQARARRTDGTLIVEADLIDIAIDSEDLRATGRVTSVTRQSADAGTGGAAGLFESGKPVYGSGVELVYTAASGTAVYRGEPDQPARLVQGENRVAAEFVTVEEETSNLRARGSVETQFVEAATEAGAEPKVADVTAETLVYEDADRLATYTGTVVFRSADGKTEADTLVLRLSASRSVAAFDATGTTVFAELAGGHEAKGEQLSYDGKTGAYTLVGRPAQAKSPDESGGGCVLTIGSQAMLTPGKGAAWQSSGTGPIQTRKVKCEVSIR